VSKLSPSVSYSAETNERDSEWGSYLNEFATVSRGSIVATVTTRKMLAPGNWKQATRWMVVFHADES
jgi:hypothetical protein